MDFVTHAGLLVQAEGGSACHVQDRSIGGNGGSGKRWLKSRDKGGVLLCVVVGFFFFEASIVLCEANLGAKRTSVEVAKSNYCVN